MIVSFGAAISSADETSLTISSGIISAKGFKKKGTVTVSGAATATMSVTGLDLGTDGCYVVTGMVKATAACGNIQTNLGLNTDTTAGNYYSECCGTKHGVAASSSQANGRLENIYANAGKQIFFAVVRQGADGYPIITANCGGYSAGNETTGVFMISKINETTNVTSIQYFHAGATIDVGSSMTVYKMMS